MRSCRGVFSAGQLGKEGDTGVPGLALAHLPPRTHAHREGSARGCENDIIAPSPHLLGLEAAGNSLPLCLYLEPHCRQLAISPHTLAGWLFFLSTHAGIHGQ